MRKICFFILMLFSFVTPAPATTQSVSSVCDLPVCDIPAAIQNLQQLNQGGRAQNLKDLRIKYRSATEPSIFVNLKEYSDLAKELFVELKEEDWVLREATYLQDLSRVALIKFSPISLTEMIGNFDGLVDVGGAYESMNFWALKIPKMEVVKDIMALISFAEHARNWAITTKQEDYFVREADKIISTGGLRLSLLYPQHEGVYDITVNCEPRPTDCGSFGLKMQRLMIFESLGGRGLLVSLSETQNNQIYYTYNNAVLTQNSTHVKGIVSEATPLTRVSEVNLKIDAVTGAVSGTLKDIAFAGLMRINGRPIKRPLEYYRDEGPSRVLPVAQILGRYRGAIGSLKGDLVLAQYTGGEVVAVFEVTENYTFAFRAGAYNSTAGVLSLTNVGTNNLGDRKLVLALRKDAQGKEMFTGFMMTGTPAVPEVFFYRVENP